MLSDLRGRYGLAKNKDRVKKLFQEWLKSSAYSALRYILAENMCDMALSLEAHSPIITVWVGLCHISTKEGLDSNWIGMSTGVFQLKGVMRQEKPCFRD